MTGKETCEYISKYLKEAKGLDVAPEDIWNASPNGELFHVGGLAWKANCYYKSKETGIQHEIVICPKTYNISLKPKEDKDAITRR